jgi:hypothetical protein
MPPKLKQKKRVGGSEAMKVFPLAGASILFGFAMLLAHFAASIDPSPGVPKMSAADIRHECSLITEDTIHAECLEQAQQAEGDGAKNLDNSLRALTAVP